MRFSGAFYAADTRSLFPNQQRFDEKVYHQINLGDENIWDATLLSIRIKTSTQINAMYQAKGREYYQRMLFKQLT